MKKVRSKALRAAIQGMPCSLRIASFAGQQCAPDETVVGCHLPTPEKGMSTKSSDLAIVAGCATCHDMLDGRNPLGLKAKAKFPGAYHQQLLFALTETQARLVEKGIINVKGDEND
jgi:cytochrome c553